MTSPVATSPIPFEIFCKVGLQVGIIQSVAPFPEARNPSYKVTVDFGERSLTTAAQLPSNYPDMSALIGKAVIGITNFPPRKIARFLSEFLVVGFPDPHGHVQLLNIRKAAAVAGTYLYPTKEPKPMIDYNLFKQADIRCGTVLTLQEGYALIDVGSDNGIRRAPLAGISESCAEDLIGTQVPVLLNSNEGVAMILTLPLPDGSLQPLGVDGMSLAPNGGELF
jgi:tRNA-binding protein